MLFQKRMVRTTFDIYVFFFYNISYYFIKYVNKTKLYTKLPNFKALLKCKDI